MKHNGHTAYCVQDWVTKDPENIKAVFHWSDPELIPKKIGIVGAQSTGKTTLANDLGERIGLPVINEIARTVNDLGWELDTKGDIRTPVLIWLGQFYQELQLEEFVADRTLLDPVIYAMDRARSSGSEKDDHFATVLANITADLMFSRYTVVFYLPIEIPLRVDGVRNTDLIYQHHIDDLFVEFLEGFGIDYFPLSGDRTTRVDCAVDYLSTLELLD